MQPKPNVGDRVRINERPESGSNGCWNGCEGNVVQTDNSDMPIEVELDTGELAWFNLESVELLTNQN